MNRRPPDAIIPPDYFDNGEIGKQTASADSYFAWNYEESTRMVLDNFVKHLPEWKRSAVQMCVMSNMTYEQAAEEISNLRGKKTDKKTVWRWARSGVEDLKTWLSKSFWVSHITQGKIPVASLEKTKPINLPWEKSNGS
jgi:DNA-directed RNA polymerase specialized sigma24 family protein